MNDEDNGKPTFRGIYRNGNAWVRHGIFLIVTTGPLLVAGVTAYNNVDDTAQRAFEQSKDNERDLQILRETQREIQRDDAVMKARWDAADRDRHEYQERITKQLESILLKIEQHVDGSNGDRFRQPQQ